MGNYWGTGRMEAFSDGVFAIAITLLILEISVPESAFNDLWSGIGHQWPSYLAYVTSFITIGGIWGAHHGIFRRLQYANRQLMLINLLLLMAVSFLPFPTKLMAEAIHDTDAERAAVIFYGGTLLVISVLVGVMWGSILRDRHVLKPEVTEQEINAITLATTPNIGFYVGVIVLAFIAPKVAAFGYLVIAIVAVLRTRGDSLPARTTRGVAATARGITDEQTPTAHLVASSWESLGNLPCGGCRQLGLRAPIPGTAPVDAGLSRVHRPDRVHWCRPPEEATVRTGTDGWGVWSSRLAAARVGGHQAGRPRAGLRPRTRRGRPGDGKRRPRPGLRVRPPVAPRE